MSHGIPPVFKEFTKYSSTHYYPIGNSRDDTCGFYISRQLSEDFPSEEWKQTSWNNSKPFKVRAVADGIVYFCGNCRDDRGQMVRIIHVQNINGFVVEVESIYVGLDDIVTKKGKISGGSVIGTVEAGATLGVQIRGCIGKFFTSIESSWCDQNFASSSW